MTGPLVEGTASVLPDRDVSWPSGCPVRIHNALGEAYCPDKGQADMVSSKSLIMSLCLLLAMAASYYWFIKLA